MNSLLLVYLTAVIVNLVIVTQESSAVLVSSWLKKDLYFDVRNGKKISSLKKEIEDRWAIPIEDQRLISNDQLLDNDLKIEDNELAKSFIWLANPLTEQMGMVYAKTINGKEKVIIPMKVGSNDTIGQLIMAISANSNLPRDKIKLFFQGKELSDRSKTAADCKLFEESWIDIKV